MIRAHDPVHLRHHRIPKGAMLTHGNVTWNCFNVLVDWT